MRGVSSIVKIMLLTSLLLTDIDSVSTMSKAIGEYGVMAVCCSILLVMTGVMFRTIIKRYTNDEDTRMKAIFEAVDMIKAMSSNNHNIAGSFDKHNMVAAQKFTNIETRLDELKQSLEDSDDEQDSIQGNINDIRDKLNDLNRKVDDLNHNIIQIFTSIDRLNDLIYKSR